MRAFLLVGAFLLASLTPGAVGDRASSVERFFDEKGRLVLELGVDEDGTDVGYARFYHHATASNDKARPGGGGGGGTPLTDCASTKYVAAGWRWSSPVSFATTAHEWDLSLALASWDAATGATIGGTIVTGSFGTAGVYDGVNQIDWVSLGTSSTIAVTTTWYYRSTGQAVESDAQYNTYYAWSTSGAAGAMDVQNIATHELGHTLGLDHPRGGGGIGCLTMYAYGSTGETAKRTLGDGDIIGIRALYGA